MWGGGKFHPGSLLSIKDEILQLNFQEKTKWKKTLFEHAAIYCDMLHVHVFFDFPIDLYHTLSFQLCVALWKNCPKNISVNAEQLTLFFFLPVFTVYGNLQCKMDQELLDIQYILFLFQLVNQSVPRRTVVRIYRGARTRSARRTTGQSYLTLARKSFLFFFWFIEYLFKWQKFVMILIIDSTSFWFPTADIKSHKSLLS